MWPALQDPASFPQAQQVAWADLRALAPSPLLLVDSQEPTDILVALAAGPLCSAAPVEASARCPLAACCFAHTLRTRCTHFPHKAIGLALSLRVYNSLVFCQSPQVAPPEAAL